MHAIFRSERFRGTFPTKILTNVLLQHIPIIVHINHSDMKKAEQRVFSVASPTLSNSGAWWRFCCTARATIHILAHLSTSRFSTFSDTSVQNEHSITQRMCCD